MLRLPPFDKIGTAPTPDFVNADPTNSVAGSIVNGQIFNQLQHEGENLELLAGLAPDGTNLAQWAQAVSRGGIWAGALTGTGDLAVATLGTALPAWVQGMRIGAVASAANTVTNPKLRVLNLGATGLYGDFTILKPDGTALAPGDMQPGRAYRFEADGAGNVVISGGGIVSGNVPLIIQNPTLYVRPDGSDTNTGSSNDAAHAFRTIAAAANYGTSRLYLSGATLTIKLGAPGTYDAPGVLPGGAVTIAIVGDANAPSSYVIQGAGPGSSNGVVGSALGTSCNLTGVQIQNTGTTNNTLYTFSGTISLQYCVVASSGQSTYYSHICSSAGGSVGIGFGVTFAASMYSCLYATNGVITLGRGANFVVSGSPSFGLAFAAADTNGTIASAGSNSFSGAATGTRYFAATNGVISTGGAGANYFPGSLAGVTQSGGQYV